MAYGVALAETSGRIVLRAADADVAPLQFGDLAAGLAENLDQVEKLAAATRLHAVTLDALLDRHAFALAADPTKASADPPREDPGPPLDFSAMDAAVAKLRASASAYDAVLPFAAPSPALAAQIDQTLIGVEHALTDARGLPGRPWYQHLVYAPGVLTGYGAKTLPGIREAIEGHRWAEAQEFIARTATALAAASDRIDAATALLKSAPP
jgi:N-acetylated-alpha-linked acidic dipeptidase